MFKWHERAVGFNTVVITIEGLTIDYTIEEIKGGWIAYRRINGVSVYLGCPLTRKIAEGVCARDWSTLSDKLILQLMV